MLWQLGPPTPNEILIKLNPFNDERQDLFCPIFQLTVVSLSCYPDWNGAHYIIEDIHVLKLMMLFKILHNLVELCLPNYVVYNTSVTRGHKYKLSIPFSRVEVYRYSLFPSTIPKWNSLPSSAVEVASVDSFVDLLWHYCTLIIWVFAIINK